MLIIILSIQMEKLQCWIPPQKKNKSYNISITLSLTGELGNTTVVTNNGNTTLENVEGNFSAVSTNWKIPSIAPKESRIVDIRTSLEQGVINIFEGITYYSSIVSINNKRLKKPIVSKGVRL